MSEAPQMLVRLSSLLEAELPRRFRPDACIAGTRIVCEVLDRLDVRARPLVVEALLFNRAFLDRFHQKGGWPGSREELLEWTDQGEAWSIALGQRGRPAQGPGKWPGHLVAVVEQEWLLDGTLGQARRPAKNLLPPQTLLASAPYRFLVADGELTLELPDPGGLLLYRAHPEVRDFRSAPDWSDPGRFEGLVGKLVGELRGVSQR